MRRFGAFGGVSGFDGQDFITYTTEDGLLDNRVLDIIQDQEGHLWFANFFGGLTRFDTETLQLLTEEPVSEILIQDRQGGLWFGREYELCYLRESRLRRRAFASTATVFGLLEDSNGGIWVGPFRDGLYYYDSPDAVWSGKGKHFTTEDGLSGINSVLSLIETRDGTIWAGTEGTPGYLCLAVHSESLTKPDLERREVNAFEAIPTPYGMTHRLFEDSQGRVYIGGRVWVGGGMGGGGLSHYDSDKPGCLYNYTMEGGLLVDSVMSIVEDDSGNLWIGTSQGLYCYDGKQFALYGREQGLSCPAHQWSTKDANGQLWFGTLGGGIYRYDGKHFQMLTTMDGLPSNSVTGFVPQSDGSMIIGTYRGIVHYHPTAKLPPSVEIREVAADEVYQNPTELEFTTTETRLLTISYHGLNFATRQMRYSYILEGHDKEWQDTWERQARYDNIPVGEYNFKVVAINRDLMESETPSILKLTVVPDPRDAKITVLQSQVSYLHRQVSAKYQFENIIGRSAAIREVQMRMELAIGLGLNVVVLITGETGTGKELAAHAIHANGSRKDQPELIFDCAATARELVVSELFGHRKGAFTGAIEDKIGYFEAAKGGTLVLDEIGDMPVDVQPNLLRVLQERKFQRVGEYDLRNVDVRIIAMTNRDLLKAVKEGNFREDLYHRLNGFPIHLPPLRERLEDIPLLAEHFLQRYSEENSRQLNGFAPDVFEMLQSYLWPGNVRELQNVIYQAAQYAAPEGPLIHTHHFPLQITHGESPIQEVLSERLGLSKSLKRLQGRMVENALRECGGNRTRAAQMLGIHRPNLVRLIRDLGIE
jgi:DNA-binding NtrC family response regulator